MVFAGSNDGTEWFFEFGTASVILIVKQSRLKMTTGSQGIPVAAWSLLLPQKQHFSNNHLTQVPITAKQQGTIAGAQDLDTIGYQLSDLEGVELQWQDLDSRFDAVFSPGVDTPFSPSTSDNIEMDSIAEIPILIDVEPDKKELSSML